MGLICTISRPTNDHALDWHPVSPWKLFVLATPVTLLCAAVSWHVVERSLLMVYIRNNSSRELSETEQVHCLVNGKQKNAVTKEFD